MDIGHPIGAKTYPLAKLEFKVGSFKNSLHASYFNGKLNSSQNFVHVWYGASMQRVTCLLVISAAVAHSSFGDDFHNTENRIYVRNSWEFLNIEILSKYFIRWTHEICWCPKVFTVHNHIVHSG